MRISTTKSRSNGSDESVNASAGKRDK